MLYFWSSLAPQHRALTMFFANFNTSQLGCQHIEMVLRNIALLTETKHLSERKKRREKQNGMQFSRVYPPHVSSTVFLAGRVIHRKALAHNTLST